MIFPTFPSKVPGLLFGLKEDGNFSSNVLNEKKNKKRLKIKICLNGCFVIPFLSAISGWFISNLSFEKFILNVPLVNKAVENFFYEIANCSIPFEQTHVV